VQLLLDAGADVTGRVTASTGLNLAPVVAAAMTDVPDVMDAVLKAGGDVKATMWAWTC
jgi:hypothetical protein